MNLEVRNAQFSYDKTNVVFRDVNFSLSEGDVLCLLGPNGCGKTTLVKCMDGLLPLKEGEIRLNGVNIKSLDRTTIAKNLGYMPQTHSPTFPFSVRDVVLTGRASHISQWSSPSKFDVELADHIMETLGIFHLARKPHTQVSDGERKLVLLARVLVQQPNVILLDEPASNLDISNQMHLLEIIQSLAAAGLSILMTSHFPNHAFLISSKVAIMNHGEIISIGRPEETLTEENLETAYNIKCRVVNLGGNIDRKVCIPLKSGAVNLDLAQLSLSESLGNNENILQ